MSRIAEYQSPAPVMVAELDERDALQGLTSKQLRFALFSFTGLNDADAYRQAFDTSGMNADTIAKTAHVLAQHPKVQAKLMELRVKSETQTSLAPLLTRQWVINGIMNIAATGDKVSTRLRAYELLGRMVGIELFKESNVTERKQRTIEEIDRELKARLSELSVVIEARANKLDSPLVPGKANPRDRRRRPKE